LPIQIKSFCLGSVVLTVWGPLLSLANQHPFTSRLAPALLGAGPPAERRIPDEVVRQVAKTLDSKSLTRISFTFGSRSDALKTKHISTSSKAEMAEIIAAFRAASRKSTAPGDPLQIADDPVDRVDFYSRGTKEPTKSFGVIYDTLKDRWGPEVEKIVNKYRRRAGLGPNF
jgi:hypothetical protein